jgi:CHAD domain-containing protein
LLAPYFKPNVVRSYQQQLRKIARALGEVRDLEVMIDDLTRYQETLDDDQKAVLQSSIDDLKQLLAAARKDLIKLLDGKEYRRFVKDFARFLTTPDGGIRKATGDPSTPYQVRHLLPALIYTRLGAVKAFDNVLEEADMLTLHALRIEFKRLRYTVSFFTDVLGKSISGFINELKVIQDHLGRLNDIGVARETLDDLLQDDVLETSQSVLQSYLEMLEAEQPELVAKFPDVWEHFNTRTVQRKLSDSLLILR